MTEAAAGVVTDTVEVGLLFRRSFRVGLDLIGARWIEHKGIITSTFVVSADREQWRKIIALGRKAAS
jgi:hypothetical protein